MPNELLDEAKSRLSMGEYLGAYDIAQEAMEGEECDPSFIHIAILSLARSGALNEALHVYLEWQTKLPDTEDFRALGARLLKDQFRFTRDLKKKYAFGERARDAYQAIYKDTKGYFPAINAATLSLLLGDRELAAELAEEVLAILDSEKEDYWSLVTRAEANLLLKEEGECKAILERAKEIIGDDFSARSTSYEQLEMICDEHKFDYSSISCIRPPTVIHYTGHMINGIGKSPGVDPEDVGLLRAQVRELLLKHNVGFAYGSLACGSDMIFADEMLKLGGSVFIHLPFSKDLFRKISVEPGGAEWLDLYDEILDKAVRVVEVVEEMHRDTELVYKTCSLEAMGTAVLRAQRLGSEIMQMSIWNGLPATGTCGTAADMDYWKELNYPLQCIEMPAPRNKVEAVVHEPDDEVTIERQLKAMIFADVKGFSKLPEAQLPRFIKEWFGRLAKIIDEHESEVDYVNTWGDAVYLVLDNVRAAAFIGHELADLMSSESWRSLGFPRDMGLRVSAHVGPVFYDADPVLKKDTYYGAHVTKTARMEPCTPVSSVYVTDAFAALIAIDQKDVFRCEYVGEMPLPKNYGKFRMYHLQKNL